MTVQVLWIFVYITCACYEKLGTQTIYNSLCKPVFSPAVVKNKPIFLFKNPWSFNTTIEMAVVDIPKTVTVIKSCDYYEKLPLTTTVQEQ